MHYLHTSRSNHQTSILSLFFLYSYAAHATLAAIMSIQVDEVENKRKMLRGELYHAFSPELVAARTRCQYACRRYANAGEVPRRRLVELWRE